MKEKKIKSKYILLLLVIICLGMIVLSLLGKNNSHINNIIGNVTTPAQKAFTKIGNFFDENIHLFDDKETLLEENNALVEKNNELTQQVASLQLEISMLEQYRDLYNLDTSYKDYNKVAANVIAKDSGNWFSTFTIDKGTNDGLNVGMNVISGNGLVGKIVSVGSNHAQVRSIIDNYSYVSVMSIETGDYGMVNGSLELRNDGCAKLEQFYDSDSNAQIGTMIVTSNVSDVYWPGIPVGYISELNFDENNLTKTGVVNLIVDFEHLKSVLIITDMKEVTQ